MNIDFSDHEQVVKALDEAFKNPKTHYTIIPKDAEIAVRWLRKNAYLRNFGWGPSVKEPMRHGQLIHLDTLYYRDRCGYMAEDYLCDHPDTEDAEIDEDTGKRMCLASTCPIASMASREDFKEQGEMDLYEQYKNEGDEEDMEWLILHSRPRKAYVENVTIMGCHQIDGEWQLSQKGEELV